MPISTFKLNTGATIPAVAFGTFGSVGNRAYKAVKNALGAGYRHIDTAVYYRNEEDVGRAIRDSGIPRSDLFVTTKVWMAEFRDVPASLERSLGRLGLDYVDLLLVHWPIALKPESSGSQGVDHEIDEVLVWKQFQDLPQEKVRAIGVSNFTVARLEKLLQNPATQVVPAVNQVELHPRLPQQKLLDYTKSKGIVLEAYSPLAQGSFQDPVLARIATDLNVDIGQVALSWGVQRGTVVLPRSTNPGRISSNRQLVDLDEAQMRDIAALGKKPQRTLNPKYLFGGIDVFDNNADS